MKTLGLKNISRLLCWARDMSGRMCRGLGWGPS
jgi:hypothetical protein